MLRALEETIRNLCRQAIRAENPEDVARFASELRVAMHEHIQLAKESLAAELGAISKRDSQQAS
jgi:hypothetical protein